MQNCPSLNSLLSINPIQSNPYLINLHSLNSNLIIRDNDQILKIYEFGCTLTQKYVITYKKYADKYFVEIRKWKKDFLNGTNDFYPSKMGIVMSIDCVDAILSVLQDIKQSGLIDKSIR